MPVLERFRPKGYDLVLADFLVQQSGKYLMPSYRKLSESTGIPAGSLSDVMKRMERRGIMRRTATPDGPLLEYLGGGVQIEAHYPRVEEDEVDTFLAEYDDEQTEEEAEKQVEVVEVKRPRGEVIKNEVDRIEIYLIEKCYEHGGRFERTPFQIAKDLGLFSGAVVQRRLQVVLRRGRIRLEEDRDTKTHTFYCDEVKLKCLPKQAEMSATIASIEKHMESIINELAKLTFEYNALKEITDNLIPIGESEGEAQEAYEASQAAYNHTRGAWEDAEARLARIVSEMEAFSAEWRSLGLPGKFWLAPRAVELARRFQLKIRSLAQPEPAEAPARADPEP
jgi:DNA-binding Lrp family transcriptional regulator/regulator of replication initiation timing